jgi:hypothetical protein
VLNRLSYGNSAARSRLHTQVVRRDRRLRSPPPRAPAAERLVAAAPRGGLARGARPGRSGPPPPNVVRQ